VSAFRRAAAAAAALVVTVVIAPAATAATHVAEPACAISSTGVTWTAHYERGRYELSALVLTGLEDCAGADLVVAIGSGQDLYAEIPVTVATGPLTVDVSEHRIPAEQVERLALALRLAVPTPAAPTTPTPADPGSTGTVSGNGQTNGSIDPAGPATTPLPTTGTNAAWFAALAAALVVLGAALRHRTRQETHRA